MTCPLILAPSKTSRIFRVSTVGVNGFLRNAPRPTEAPPFQRVFRITRHQQHSQIGTHTAYLLRQHPAAHLRHDGIGQKQVDHPLEHGLWRPADFTATSYISTWMSTDCRRTPENPATANTCTANTAKW